MLSVRLLVYRSRLANAANNPEAVPRYRVHRTKELAFSVLWSYVEESYVEESWGLLEYVVRGPFG